jgi:hypothetical protein
MIGRPRAPVDPAAMAIKTRPIARPGHYNEVRIDEVSRRLKYTYHYSCRCRKRLLRRNRLDLCMNSRDDSSANNLARNLQIWNPSWRMGHDTFGDGTTFAPVLRSGDRLVLDLLEGTYAIR